ncbi:MAG: endonuclease/exonuclease/phosphatase family protein [Chitinophagaceae bacterium]
MIKKISFYGLFLSVLYIASCASKPVTGIKRDNNSLKLMSYNVHHCNPPSRPGVIDVDAIAAVIKKENPDIVALQEIDVNTGRSGKINQAAQLAVKAGYPSFFFAKTIDFDGGQYGIAILSKYPLTNTQVHRLPTDVKAGGEPRVLTTAAVTLPGGKVLTIGCTHLDAENDPASRLLQVREINRLAAEITTPFLIAGDFNAAEGSAVINILDEKFVRTCQQCKPTFPDSDARAIDFIAYRSQEHFSVKEHQTISGTNASDHFPIVAALQLKF